MKHHVIIEYDDEDGSDYVEETASDLKTYIEQQDGKNVTVKVIKLI